MDEEQRLYTLEEVRQGWSAVGHEFKLRTPILGHHFGEVIEDDGIHCRVRLDSGWEEKVWRDELIIE